MAARGDYYKNWSYAWRVKKDIGADFFVVMKDVKPYSTGRDRYLVYYLSGRNAESYRVISRHNAMQMTKDDSVYYVVQKVGITFDNDEDSTTCEQLEIITMIKNKSLVKLS
jgi:hypothetical protein